MTVFDNFKEIDLRVAAIVNVEDHELARKPMFKLTLDLGEELGRRTVVAGIKGPYTKEELIGKKVICIANLEPKDVAGVMSQGMLLAAEDPSNISLLTVDRDVLPGSKIR